MYPRTLAACIVIAVVGTAQAQSSSCVNSDFEQGTFTNWNGTTGSCCPINSPTPGIINGRHTVMTGAGFDPNTAGDIPLVAPGGSFSARLGNQNTGAQAEQLTYSMLVDESNALFVYKYAVVLEDPSHQAWEQPRFEISMFDEFDNPIDCGIYNVYASGGIPGFQTISSGWGSDIHYKTWTTVGMDLSSYIGQTVTIVFSTGDCVQGGHFGYAYIDCYCSPLQLSTDFCPGLGTTTLTAPVGFESYLWSTGETTESIVVNDPQTGQEISCVLTSVTGCQVTLTSVLTPSIVFAGFDTEGDCMNAVQFTNESYVLSGPAITSIEWDFGDGSISEEEEPFHQYGSPGPHQIRQVVFSETGCTDTLYQTISFDPSPVVEIDVEPGCIGQVTQFEDVSILADGVAERRWDFGNNSSLIGPVSPSLIYDALGTYEISLYLAYDNGCHDSTTVSVTIYPVPILDIGPDSMFCDGTEWTLATGLPGLEHLWSTGSTDPSIVVTENAEYSVTVISADGCSVTDEAMIEFYQLPEMLLVDTAQCVEQVMVLDAGNPGCEYYWSTGETTQSIEVSSNSGTFTVRVTTPDGCVDSTTVDVTFYNSLHVDLGPDTVVCEFDTLTLNAFNPEAFYFWSDGSTDPTLDVALNGTYYVHTTNGYCHARDSIAVIFEPYPAHVEEPLISACFDIPGTIVTMDAGTPGSVYLWSTGETTQVIEVEEYGWYTVEITGEPNCTTRDSIRVAEHCPPQFYIPNTFTPNGDGKNESFGPFSYNIHSEEFLVFDRWGEVIFRSYDPQPLWDGMSNGKRVPDGVYVWSCAYRPIEDIHGKLGKRLERMGHVTVLH